MYLVTRRLELIHEIEVRENESVTRISGGLLDKVAINANKRSNVFGYKVIVHNNTVTLHRMQFDKLMRELTKTLRVLCRYSQHQ